jgi:manganese transport protein
MGSASQPDGTAHHSLEDIHASVPIPQHSWWRRFFAFSGPAFLISIGYMDPGNWGADLKAGSKFEYRLLWVLLMSNVMAVLLQALATRLGVVTGRDLAQACRESYPRPTVFGLWGLCEIAIAACDLAEVIGTVIALKLLFGMPYLWGLVVAGADTFLLLALQRRGIRLLELLTLALIGIIGVSLGCEILFSRPDWSAAVLGLVPGLPGGNFFLDSVLVSIAMIGATVMPHNLYLHSALVQTRAFPKSVAGKKLACKFNFLDSVIALNGAFFINAAILILAAATFFEADKFNAGEQVEGVEDLAEAHRLVGEKLWNAAFDSKTVGVAITTGLFAIALLASGQSSTLTGTLAGQVVMEGFVHMRLRPWVRRMLTRSVALVPALLVIQFFARDDGSGQSGALMDLLVLSQVVLSLQLPFAVIPLIQFTSDPERMGPFANRLTVRTLSWASAAVIVAFNGVALVLQIQDWGESTAKAGGEAWWVYIPVGGLTLVLTAFLAWIALYPALVRRREYELGRPGRTPMPTPSSVLEQVRYRTIGVAVEFTPADAVVLVQAAKLAHSNAADLVLVHVVEGMGADLFGPETDSQESRTDSARMAELTAHLRQDGLSVEGMLGYGSPPTELIRLANEKHFDLLVMGTHGHRFLADIALGRTITPLLHELKIPVLVVPAGE